MSTITPIPPAPTTFPDWMPPRIHRMTVEKYERLVESGALPSRNRLHLINGYVVERITITPPHAVTDELCGVELLRVMPAGWHARPSLPLRLPAQSSAPEPDRCIVRGAIDDYDDHHPGPEDVALVVEIADSSLAEDRDYAARLYGPAGVPVCWIVDVNARRVEVYTQPGPRGYNTMVTFTEGQSIPLIIDGQEIAEIAVTDLLPSAPRPNVV